MQISNLALAYIVEELRPLVVGAFVNKVQEIGKGTFKLKLHTKDGSKDLVVTDKALFLSDYAFPVRENPNTFFVKLKNSLLNKKIVSISQFELDRVVVIEFSELFLILELFQDSNIILTDKAFDVLQLLYQKEWKDRELKKGKKYVFPKTNKENPAKVSGETLFEQFEKSSAAILEEILSKVNISPVIISEILLELKISGKTKAKEISQKDAKKIAQKMNEFYSLKKTKAPSVLNGTELLPFEFGSLKNQTPAPSFSAALSDFYAKEYSGAPKIATAQEKDLNRLKSSLEQQKSAKEKLEKQAEEAQSKGDLIYAHFAEIQEIMQAVLVAHKKQLNKKEVMYKLNLALGQKKTPSKLKVEEIDFAKKEITLAIESG